MRMYFPARVPGPVQTKSMKLNFARPLFRLRLVDAMFEIPPSLPLPKGGTCGFNALIYSAAPKTTLTATPISYNKRILIDRNSELP